MFNDIKKTSADAFQLSAILTKVEAAQLLSCTPRFIERMVAQGRLRACKVSPKFVRFYRSDIDRFLLEGATIGGEA